MNTLQKTVLSSFALMLCAACAGGGGAMTSPGEPAPVEGSETASTETPGRSNGEVAMGALKGAGKGARACALPLGVGLLAGPFGGVVGGYLSFICLPFGLAAGALVGAAGTTNHPPQAEISAAR